MRKINLIVIHCSATPVTHDYTPEQMTIDHRARGFNSAGYHFYIRKSGYVVHLRPLDQVGAHVEGYNANSVGICYEGGLASDCKDKSRLVPTDTRTDQQKESLLRIIKELKTLYPGITKIVGHRDLSPDKDGDGVIEPSEWMKMCPCFNAIPEYKMTLPPTPKGEQGAVTDKKE
jgi:N-acetylmuramoyl-L-alanine amidase